jgi:hypothetical protein
MGQLTGSTMQGVDRLTDWSRNSSLEFILQCIYFLREIYTLSIGGLYDVTLKSIAHSTLQVIREHGYKKGMTSQTMSLVEIV